MLKWFFIGYILTHILVHNVTSRRLDIDSLESESESIEIPVRNRPRSNRFSIFRKVEDPLFNFIDKLLNTAHRSTKMTLSRAKNRSEKRKELENEIDKFLEELPTFPIPVLDDIAPVINNAIQK